MRYVWLAAAFVVTLLVGLLVGIALGGGESGEQGSGASSPRTVTVEKTVPERAGANPKTTTNSMGSLHEARAAFERAVAGYGNPNLEVGEVMEFANNYYAEVEEKDTGIGAMELLINRPGSRVYPEPGPNMMWNTKYGMMGGSGGMGGMMGSGGSNGGGMMGGFYQPSQASPNDQLPITPEDGTQIAKDYITRNSLGTDTEKPDQFYGYYTVDTKNNGEVNGMLSVNGYTGAVWFHTWHGLFIGMEEEAE